MAEISTPRLLLRSMTVADVSQDYVDWLNDPEVNRYLEVRHAVQTLEGCKSYVAGMESSEADFLFGVFLLETGRHIGNTRLGFINSRHQRAQLSLFIGDRSCWGKGYATEIIRAVTAWGFETQGLEKIDAGCYAENLGSLRAFLKCGYQVEGFFRKASALEGRRIDSFWTSILKDEFER